MTGNFEKMTMADGAAVAVYRALPDGERRGGLVLVQEIFGVTEHIREMCHEYAEDGYEVLAPALFDREEPGSRRTIPVRDSRAASCWRTRSIRSTCRWRTSRPASMR